MAIYIIQNIKLPIEASKDDAIFQARQRLLKFFSQKEIGDLRIHKCSVDARKQEDIRFVYSVAAEVLGEADEKKLAAWGISKAGADELRPTFGNEPMSARPVIVGFGPCGMFAALLLAENGYRPIVIERGASVEERTGDVERFFRFGILDGESNIQFGAGGAGTFSDGKLVTRIKDPLCGYVLSEMHKLGAPDEILYKAKPHIGTDHLKTVVAAMEQRIVSLGGEVCYHTRLEGIHSENGVIRSVTTSRGEIPCGVLLLAIGHSARDTFRMLRSTGVSMTPKAFSVGVRIEHLQEDIDAALYGKAAGHPALPIGEYNLSAHCGGRGVYTFCMCPGGTVVAAASEEGGVVTNGMSSYARDGKNANSAVAVSVDPSDYGGTVEKAVAFQRSLESLAFRAGGESYAAPCETVGDFLGRTAHREPSRVLPTYRDGAVKMTRLDSILPPFVADTLKFGLADFDRKIHGFAADHAVLTGVETRTSSPLRIPRGENGVAEGYQNLYPAGEGAGYAGGITSAAVDGLRAALAIMARYRKLQ